jgi:transposase-like protein
MSRPVSPEEKREWGERVRLQNESGQSVLRWCREHQINYNSMLYWRSQFGLTPTRAVERSSFKELPAATESTGITIEYQKVQIHLSKNLDPTILMKYLRALKGEL